MHQTQTITCFSCGGHVHVQVQAASMPCPYCGTQLHLREDLHRHAARVESTGQALLGREALARRQAAMHARAAKHNGPMVALVVVFAILLTWWFVAGVSGVAAKMPLSISAPLVALTAAEFVALGLVWASMMRPPDDQELGAVGLATCENCGGFVTFEQGQALSACSYCHAQALKPAALAREVLARGHQALEAGRRDAVSAEADNWRTASEARLGGVKMGTTGWVAIIVIAAFGITAALIAGMASDASAEQPTWWIWVVVAGSVVAMVALVVRAVKQLIADNAAFERRFNVKIAAGVDALRPPNRSPG